MDEKPVRWKKKPARCFESSRDKYMLRFGGYLLRFHFASDWSQNNKHSINFLWCSRFYGNDCNLFAFLWFYLASVWWLHNQHVKIKSKCSQFYDFHSKHFPISISVALDEIPTATGEPSEIAM